MQKQTEENVSPKIEIKVSKDINENILNERDLNRSEKLVTTTTTTTITTTTTPKKIKFRKYTFDDFVLLKVLGRGSFGKVSFT